ncbi:MAG: glycosyltransferase family 39 protein, partial [Candidatus Hydrogenedentes bacterium]|nr:glycosyltransferase family 39 protein [Candidatus Hydrogenedentota bacterium]
LLTSGLDAMGDRGFHVLGISIDLADSVRGGLRVAGFLGLVLLFAGLANGIGRWEALAGAALTAISPAMVFYSRYHIQEMAFVFFGAGLIVSGWRYAMSRRVGWAICAGACVGLMAATKETCILAWAAMGGALFVVAVFEQPKAALARAWLADLSWRHVALVALVALMAAETVISGFWTNMRGALDLFTAHFHYLNRTAGMGLHDHPWYYYLKMLLYTQYGPGPWWSEGLIVGLAAVGGAMAWWRPRDPSPEARLRRFVAPYKTPWCMLGFLQGMIVLAGIGVVGLVRRMPHVALKCAVLIALVLASAQLGMQAYRASFRFDADPRNPYVYGHTSRNLLRLVERFEDIAKVAPEGRHLLIKVLDVDAWPLPWYLRKFDHVGYWPGPIDDPDAAIVITSQEHQAAVEGLLHGKYQTEIYGLRPDVLIVAFIRQDLWDAFMQTRTAGR